MFYPNTLDDLRDMTSDSSPMPPRIEFYSASFWNNMFPSEPAPVDAVIVQIDGYFPVTDMRGEPVRQLWDVEKFDDNKTYIAIKRCSQRQWKIVYAQVRNCVASLARRREIRNLTADDRIRYARR